MVTSSPDFTVFGLKPLRISELGVLASKLHFSIFPSAPVTSRKNHECGFSRRTAVITPFTVTGLSASNSAANEWWARAGAASVSDAIAAKRRCFMPRIIDLELDPRGNGHAPARAEGA